MKLTKLIEILVASVLVALLVRPQLLDRFECTDNVDATTPPPLLDFNLTEVFEKHHLRPLSLKDFKKDDLVIGIILMCCLMTVTCCLIYGTILARPKHMTAFFCVKMMEISATGLAMLSYFSSTHELKRWIAAQPCWPMKELILHLDDNNLMALTLVIFVSVMFCKLYFIGVIWACYKYLQHYAGTRAQTQPTVRRYNTDIMQNTEDTEMLLPPKYEDVIRMPAATAAAEGGPQPPAYTED